MIAVEIVRGISNLPQKGTHKATANQANSRVAMVNLQVYLPSHDLYNLRAD